MVSTTPLGIGKIVELQGKGTGGPPDFPEIKFREPVSFDEFIERKIASGEINGRLAEHYKEDLDQWRKYNKGCFER